MREAIDASTPKGGASRITAGGPRFVLHFGVAAALALVTVLAGCSSDEEADRGEDTAFALLEESHDFRSAGDFDAAAARLAAALELAEPGSDAESSIRDELFYSLPLARARRAAKDGDTSDLAAILAPAREYIRDHPDRFARAREIAELIDLGAGAPVENAEEAFALLEESHALKARSEFGAAAERLERALSLVRPNSDAERAIRDELFYYLPVARARWSLAQHDPAAVDAALAPVNEYLQRHPERFELAREVEALAEATRMLRHAIGVNARARFHGVRLVLTTHYMEYGDCPSDLEVLSRLIGESGMDIPESFVPESLDRQPEGCSARFRNTESGEHEELRWP